MSSSFFQRGNGPLVSVIFPTRERPNQLIAALDSCIKLAANPKNVEVLLKVDEDDVKTIAAIENYLRDCPSTVKAFVTPRGKGYLDIHNWLNALAAEAAGDWLFVLSDDAKVETQDWDEILNSAVIPVWHGFPEDVCMLIPHIGDGKQNSFFLLRRKTFELMGRVCGSPFGDTWLMNIMLFIHSTARLPLIKVNHYREGNDYFQSGSHWSHWEDFGSLVSSGGILGQASDVTRLLSHIAFREIRRVWKDKPGVYPDWYTWRANSESKLAYIAHLGGDVCRKFGSIEGGEELKVSEIGGIWSKMGAL